MCQSEISRIPGECPKLPQLQEAVRQQPLGNDERMAFLGVELNSPILANSCTSLTQPVRDCVAQVQVS